MQASDTIAARWGSRPLAVGKGSQVGTVDGVMRPGSKTEAFIKASRVPVAVPLSGRTKAFTAAGLRAADCGKPSN